MLNISPLQAKKQAPQAPRFGIGVKAYLPVQDRVDKQQQMADDLATLKIDKFSFALPMERLSDMMLGASLSGTLKNVTLLKAAQIYGLPPQTIFHIAHAVAQDRRAGDTASQTLDHLTRQSQIGPSLEKFIAAVEKNIKR